jgi:putative MATE family efflux protein
MLNIVLAPVLIFGWGTGRALGVSGAAVASLVSIAIGVVVFFGYFLRSESYLRFDLSQWRPDWGTWRAMIRVGAPAGAEFLVLSIYLGVVQAIIRPFGAAAQAGFGIAARVMQSLFLPVVAIGLAAAPLAGQNFGARKGARVRRSFHAAVLLATTLMIVVMALCQLFSAALVGAFSREPAVIAIGAECLRIVSWNLVSLGAAYTSSSIFQGLGHTLPPLASSALRLVLFIVPTYLLSLRAGFQIREVWYLSVASVAVQAVLNILLLRREFDRTLKFEPAHEEGVGAIARSG